MQEEQRIKKQAERKILDLFAEAYPDFPRGKVFNTESPDFVIMLNPRHRMGIEITRLSKVNPLKKRRRASLKLSKEFLVNRIESKEEKLPLYRRKQIRQCWLILVDHHLLDAVSFNLNNQLQAWDIHSDFEKVFLFDDIKGRILTVQ